MGTLPATILGALAQVQNLATAAVLSAFLALAVRSFAQPFVDRGRHGFVTLIRVAAGAAFLGLGALYGLFTASMMVWDGRAVVVAMATALLVLVRLAARHVMGQKRPGKPPGVVAGLVQLSLLLALLLVAALTLMRAGFVALTQDRIVMLVDVTGETATQVVRWAPPDQPLREEALTTHRVVFRAPGGERVAEAWIYGDQVAVKGRVLRLSPILNAAGVPNLFELSFVHNGHETSERHNAYPHTALPLVASGPLAVHPWWRPLQARLLERWEKGASGDSPWVVRAATTESTYYALVDANGKPVQQRYQLVLTPGGLSAS